MTDDERTILLAAIVLLGEATSNSLNPEHREAGNLDRDTVVRELKGMVR